MPDFVQPMAEWAAAVIELMGIGLVTFLAVTAFIRAVLEWRHGEERDEIFRNIRLRLIRGILVGLEFLVAADIIHTVAIELTFESVGVLTIIVLVRTFLSFTLELEMTGRWPWQQNPQEG